MQPSSALSILSQYDPNIPQLKSNAESAYNTASNYQSAAALLPAKLKQAIEEKLNYNQDLISQRNQAQADYFAAPSAARLKYQDIANPFQREALVSSSVANAYAPYATAGDILSERQGSIKDIVNEGTGAFNSAVSAQQAQAQQAQDAYQNAIALAQWIYGVKHPSGGGVGSAAYNQNRIKAAQADAISGMTLRDLVTKYTGEVDPTSIYQIYNQVNYGENKANFSPGQGGYGSALESLDELTSLGIVPEGLTADMKNKQAALKPAQEAINQIRNLDINQTGPQNKVAQLKLQFLGGLGVNQNLVSLNQNLELLKQNVVRALQGSRASDQDIALAQSYIPSITDTPETITTKLNNLQNLINSLSGNSSSSSSRPSLDSFNK